MKLVNRGDNDFDLVDGELVIELSRGEETGGWTFWNVRFKDDRFGGTQLIGPGPFHDWLDEQREALAAALPSTQGDDR